MYEKKPISRPCFSYRVFSSFRFSLCFSFLVFLGFFSSSPAFAVDTDIGDHITTPFSTLVLEYPFSFESESYDRVLVLSDNGSPVNTVQYYFTEDSFDVEIIGDGENPGVCSSGFTCVRFIPVVGDTNSGKFATCYWEATTFISCSSQDNVSPDITGSVGGATLYSPVFFHYGGFTLEGYPERANSFGIVEFLEDAIEDPLVFEDLSDCDTTDWVCYLQGFLTNLLKNIASAIYPDPIYMATYFQKYQDLIDIQFPIFNEASIILDEAGADWSTAGATFTSPQITLFGHTEDIINIGFLNDNDVMSTLKSYMSLFFYISAFFYALHSIRAYFKQT